MSSTLLEVTRASHEEVERLERLIVKDLRTEPPSSRERLHRNHRVRHLIDQITQTTNKLAVIYQDSDNSRKDEIAALGTNVVSAFNERLNEITDYHRRHPSAEFVDANDDYEELLKDEPQVEFSGEEAQGRYLDLHELYNEFINSRFGEPIEYTAYLEIFNQPDSLPRRFKFLNQYREYLQKLVEYLVYFIERTQPLHDIDRMLAKVATEFEGSPRGRKRTRGGLIRSCNGEDDDDDSGSRENGVIDLDYYSTAQELMEVGPEKLKEALSALGLKTGGTVEERAKRLFLTKDSPLQKLDKKHFAKVHGFEDRKEETALMEAKLQKLCGLLEETIARTKENVVKRQALTYEEIEMERREDEEEAESENDDDDEHKIHNPLKLPMGFDGRPIPFWLYKLHGLGQEFKCEICGNCSYRGRREYERHFKEGRHQHGMRCLGIPNTKNFNEITSIDEARQLWEKIREQSGAKKWRPDLEEEYEDEEGNIYNKKTFTDLKRQGLI